MKLLKHLVQDDCVITVSLIVRDIYEIVVCLLHHSIRAVNI